MEKFTISEYVDLPSKGLIYDEPVASEIHLSSMTTRHEMQRLAPSKSQFKALCGILDDCILEDIGISSYDLYSGDYQFLMFKLRIATYGPELHLEDHCPHCGKVSSLPINLDDLLILSNIEEFNKYKTLILPKSKKEIVLNYQTPRLLDEMTEETRNYKDRTKGTQPDQTMVFLIKNLIKTIDGHAPDPIMIEEWLRDLPMLDMRTITAHVEKMDEQIGVDTNLTIRCDDCGKEHKSQLRINSEFFRPNLNI